MEASAGTEMEGVALMEAGDSWREGDAQGITTAMTTSESSPSYPAGGASRSTELVTLVCALQGPRREAGQEAAEGQGPCLCTHVVSSSHSLD